MTKAIVFDLGGVLIDWDPRYLYQKVFDDPQEMDYFLTQICTPAWNEEQDAGRTIEEANQTLAAQHPRYAEQIHIFYERWMEMLNGPIEKNLAVFRTLRDAGHYPIYALTNWSAETMPWARPSFPFLEEFDGMVVSGIEKVKKPDPRIYQILFQRFDLIPETTVFIDDNEANILAAKKLGMQTIWMQKTTELKQDLARLGVQLNQ